MKLHFHGEETFNHTDLVFKKVPNGVYMVRTSVEPSEGECFEPYDFQWPVLLKDGTIIALECEVRPPDA